MSHRRPAVTIVERKQGRFEVSEARAGEKVALSQLDLELLVDDVYRGLSLEAE